jgi:hypothetical protein
MTELVIGAAVILATVFVAEGVWERHRIARHRVKIADCQDGQLAMIVGKVVAMTELVETPITGRPCVAYVVVGKFRQWRRREKIATTTFAVDDGTARAIVEADDVALELEMGRNRIDSRRARTDRATLRALGMAGVDRLYEGALEEGVTVAVFGEVQLLSVAGTSPTSGYRDGHVTHVKIVRPRRRLFLISDKASIVDTRD